MSISVKTPDARLEAAAEIYALDRGFTWRTNIFDTASRELVDQLKHAGEPFDSHDAAAFDAERKALEHMQAFQAGHGAVDLPARE